MAGMPKNDRMLAARVRSLALTQIESALKGTDEEFKKALLLKLSTSLLPRLNELTGEDGEPIKFNLINYGQFGSTVQVPAETVPTPDTPSTTEVQDSSSS